MPLTRTTDGPPRAARRRPAAAALALVLASFAGCAVRQGVLVPTRAAKGPAPDLLDVSDLAARREPETKPVAAKPASVDRAVARTANPEPSQLPAPTPAPGLPPPETAPGMIPGASGRMAAPPSGAGRVTGAGPGPMPGLAPMSPLPAPAGPGTAAALPPEVPYVTTPAPASMASFPMQPPSSLAGATPASIPIFGRPYPIDLPTALRLADDQNPEIAEARIAIMSASAQQLAAYAILMPSLNAGTSYHGHAGNLQRSTGQILNVSQQDVVVGAGARTISAESMAIPGVNLFGALTDAIYNPLATHQTLIGTRFNAAATANSVLLEVSRLYLELLGAQAELQLWRQSAGEADEVAKIVIDYYLEGQGRKADADRADTERRRFQAEIIEAEEDVALASARLSARLNLDAAIRLEIPAWQMEPLMLINADAPTEELVRTAVARHPIIAARRADVGSAEFRLRRELSRPWLPTLWIAFSGDSFGGGSNIVTPTVGNFGGRTDFDARVFWTLLNGGFGNAALQKQQRAEVNEAIASRIRAINRVRDEVTSARAEALAQRQQVATARVQVHSAEDGYREDRIHLRESLGRPIETVNSLFLLARARIDLIRAITRLNQAQFGLWVALGSPPPLGPDTDPNEPSAGPPPLPVPLNSPIGSGPIPLIPVPPPPPPVLMK